MSDPTTQQPPTPPAGDSTSDEIAIQPVVWTTGICLAFAVFGHAMLWAAYAFRWGSVPWEPVAGISLSGVAIVAFGGFYIASRRARIAITASFLLTFLVMLPFAVTIDALNKKTAHNVNNFVDDFRNIVGLIVGFYFASEAAVSGLKVFQAGRGDRNLADIQRADRDLAPAPSTKA